MCNLLYHTWYTLRLTFYVSHVYAFYVKNWKLTCIKHIRILEAAGRALFALSAFDGALCLPCVAHIVLVMLRLTLFVAHLITADHAI